MNQQNVTSLRFIQCQVGAESYALDMAWVRTILRYDHLQAEPGAAGLCGSVQVQQMDVPVYRLAQRLGLPPTVSAFQAQQRIIVLNDPLEPWAILVDTVSQVQEVEAAQVFSFPAVAQSPQRPFFTAVLLLGEALVLVLAPPFLHPDTAVPEQFAPEPPPLRASATQTPTHEHHHGRVTVFSLPNVPANMADTFGLSLTQVAEILRPPNLLAVPGAPNYVLGLWAWRHRPLPVIDLAVRLGLPVTGRVRHGRERLLIARLPEANGYLGFYILPTVQILTLPLGYKPISMLDVAGLAIPDPALTHTAVQVDKNRLHLLNLGQVQGNRVAPQNNVVMR